MASIYGTLAVTKSEFDVVMERCRQRDRWSDANDNAYPDEMLAEAGSFIADPTIDHYAPEDERFDMDWVVGLKEELSENRRQQLVVAAALIIAEIDKIDRREMKP